MLKSCADSMDWPSIDRKDSSKNYTIDNCRYIEYSENCRKRGKHVRNFYEGGKK